MEELSSGGLAAALQAALANVPPEESKGEMQLLSSPRIVPVLFFSVGTGILTPGQLR